MNKKSDVEAKHEYMKILEAKGFSQISIAASPADIICYDKTGKKYYFEIKFTTKKDKYFGAATLTEWRCAADNKDTYFFVVAHKNEKKWMFHEYSATQFLEYSSIPPFKIYFNLDLKIE